MPQRACGDTAAGMWPQLVCGSWYVADSTTSESLTVSFNKVAAFSSPGRGSDWTSSEAPTVCSTTRAPQHVPRRGVTPGNEDPHLITPWAGCGARYESRVCRPWVERARFTMEARPLNRLGPITSWGLERVLCLARDARRRFDKCHD